MVEKYVCTLCVCREEEGQLLLEHMGLGARAALLHRTCPRAGERRGQAVEEM